MLKDVIIHLENSDLCHLCVFFLLHGALVVLTFIDKFEPNSVYLYLYYYPRPVVLVISVPKSTDYQKALTYI